MDSKLPGDDARLLRETLLEELSSGYPGREELLELVALSLVAGENLLVIGPPGTAKSEVVSEFARRSGCRYFEYLLTRFTEPSEVFGALDLAAFREGEYRTRTEGMLPDAEIVFLDEIFQGGSAILNSLLGILNEGVFRRGQDRRPTEILSVIAAANSVPDDPALSALLDRFTLRLSVDYLESTDIGRLLEAAWRNERRRDRETPGAAAPARGLREVLLRLHRQVASARLDLLRPALAELIVELRAAGLTLSDRRAAKLQNLAAASAILCGRLDVARCDLWPTRYLLEHREDREALADILSSAATLADGEGPVPLDAVHPLAREAVCPSELHAQLDVLEAELRAAPSGKPDVHVDALHNRLQDLDAERRWCRARDAEEAAELDRLEERLQSLAAGLATAER